MRAGLVVGSVVEYTNVWGVVIGSGVIIGEYDAESQTYGVDWDMEYADVNLPNRVHADDLIEIA